ncbi:MAG: metallophosphoesterase [Deltaproteobacteria bacterium]|jgi:predicted MPP superfamily phosphohydrolase|nr:metallophosphoesterase [Deltaproteobacteria bacterium]
MPNFFFIVSSVLFCAHGYFFFKLRQAFGGGLWQAPVVVFILSMMGLLLFRRHDLFGSLSQQLTGVAYIWLGFLLFASLIFLASDFLAVLRILLKAIAGLNVIWPSAAFRAVLCLFLASGLTGYAFYSAHTPQLRHVVIGSSKLPANLSVPEQLTLGPEPFTPGQEQLTPESDQRLRIVAISDVHLSESLGVDFLGKIAALVESQKPDIIAITGDLVDTDMSGRSADAAILRSLTARYGKYAVIGNHEVHRGLASARAFIAESGFTLLENRAVLDASGIVVVGVNDRSMREVGADSADPVAIIKKFPAASTRFVLMLKHRPLMSQDEIGLVDLQLSGHTHGGQVWPGSYLAKAANNDVEQGLTVYSREGQGETNLYLSNGVGYWGPPMRFLAPAEITVIDLISQP